MWNAVRSGEIVYIRFFFLWFQAAPLSIVEVKIDKLPPEGKKIKTVCPVVWWINALHFMMCACVHFSATEHVVKVTGGVYRRSSRLRFQEKQPHADTSLLHQQTPGDPDWTSGGRHFFALQYYTVQWISCFFNVQQSMGRCWMLRWEFFTPSTILEVVILF